LLESKLVCTPTGTEYAQKEFRIKNLKNFFLTLNSQFICEMKTYFGVFFGSTLLALVMTPLVTWLARKLKFDSDLDNVEIIKGESSNARK